jgi:hypothetical protein
MFRSIKLGIIVTVALLLVISGTALAGQKHVAYERTLDDLRTARALLQRANAPQTADGQQDEVSLAISNIDGAIAEISKEAAVNAANPQDIPKGDSRMKWSQRLSKSFKLLDKAKLDCSTEKDNSGDAGLQKRVLDRIDEAHNRIRVAIDTVNFDYSARNMPTRND